MERSEPALVPEWLRSTGSVTGGGTSTHQLASSLQSGIPCFDYVSPFIAICFFVASLFLL